MVLGDVTYVLIVEGYVQSVPAGLGGGGNFFVPLNVVTPPLPAPLLSLRPAVGRLLPGELPFPVDPSAVRLSPPVDKALSSEALCGEWCVVLSSLFVVVFRGVPGAGVPALLGAGGTGGGPKGGGGIRLGPKKTTFSLPCPLTVFCQQFLGRERPWRCSLRIIPIRRGMTGNWWRLP